MPKVQSNVPDTDALFTAFRRRWFSATFLGFVALVACGAGLFYVLPQKYSARTLLHMASFRPYMLTSRAETLIDFANYQKTQIAIIKSRLVLDAAVADERLKNIGAPWKDDNPAEWLEKELKVDYKVAPEVLSISMSGQQPQQLTALVSAVRDAYVRQVVNKERNEKMELLNRLEKLYETYANALTARRGRYKEIAESVGSRDAMLLTRKQQSALERLSLAQRELAQLQFDLRRAQVMEETELKTKWKPNDARVSDREVEELIAADKSVQEHTAEVVKHQQALALMRNVTVLGESDPSMAPYRNALEAAKSALDQRRSELRAQFTDQLRQKRQHELAEKSLQRRKEIEASQELEKILTGEVQKFEHEATATNKGALNLEEIKEEVTQAEGMAKRVAEQVEALKMELQAPSRVSLLEDAVVSHDEEDKKKMRVVGAGSLGGMLFAMFGVVMLEWRRRKVNHSHDVVNNLGIRLLGELPSVPKVRNYETEQWSVATNGGYQYDAWVEAVNAARTILLQASRNESVRCIMIASAMEGEGKTSLASHLASSLAHKYARVLLIDGDLRRPSVHRKFNGSNERGLADVLRGEARDEEVIQPTPVKNLFLMSAGHCDYRAIQALAQDSLAEMLAKLKKEYDYIVIDSSPLLHVADPLMIAQHTDGVIFSILRDVSRLPNVYAAYEKIKMLHVRILGSIVHGVKQQKRGYYKAIARGR